MPDSFDYLTPTHPILMTAYGYVVLVLVLAALLPLLRRKLRIIHVSLQQQEKIIFQQLRAIREQVRQMDQQWIRLQQMPEKALQSLQLAVIKQIQGHVQALLAVTFRTRSLLFRIFAKSLVNESFRHLKKFAIRQTLR